VHVLDWLAHTPYAEWVNQSWGWPLALTVHAFLREQLGDQTADVKARNPVRFGPERNRVSLTVHTFHPGFTLACSSSPTEHSRQRQLQLTKLN
jgi:hypothetical protein